MKRKREKAWDDCVVDEVKEKESSRSETFTSAPRNQIFPLWCLPTSITHAPPLLAFPALRVCTLSDKWEEPWLNLLTVCNTAQSANSPHCPDLLYTSQGSGGLLGQVWAVPCCLLLGSCFCNALSPFFCLVPFSALLPPTTTFSSSSPVVFLSSLWQFFLSLFSSYPWPY